MSNSEFIVLPAVTDDQKEKLFGLREEVFVVEQKVDRAEEFDEFETSSFHFVAVDMNDNAIGAARWRSTNKGIKLERFAVKKTWRSKGVGTALVQAVIEDIQRQEGNGHRLYLHAQLDAIPLYEKFDFVKIGDLFEECNILHYTMERMS